MVSIDIVKLMISKGFIAKIHPKWPVLISDML